MQLLYISWKHVKYDWFSFLFKIYKLIPFHKYFKEKVDYRSIIIEFIHHLYLTLLQEDGKLSQRTINLTYKLKKKKYNELNNYKSFHFEILNAMCVNATFQVDKIIMLNSNGINNVNVSDSLQDDLLLRNTKRDHEFYGHSKMNNEL